MGIINRHPSVFKFNRLHVHIFRLFELYYIDSSKMIGNFPEVFNFNRFYSYSTGSIVTCIGVCVHLVICDSFLFVSLELTCAAVCFHWQFLVDTQFLVRSSSGLHLWSEL